FKYALSALILASRGQTKQQRLEPAQPSSPRSKGCPPRTPSASKPRKKSLVEALWVSSGTGLTFRRRQASSRYVSNSEARKPSTACQRSSSSPGVLRQVPELMRVVPPSASPVGIGRRQLPIAAESPSLV